MPINELELKLDIIKFIYKSYLENKQTLFTFEDFKIKFPNISDSLLCDVMTHLNSFLKIKLIADKSDTFNYVQILD